METAAKQRRRSARFIPAARELEQRQLLSIAYQRSILVADLALNTVGGNYNNTIEQPNPINIKDISDSSNKSATEPATGQTGSYSISLESTIPDKTLDAGRVNIYGDINKSQGNTSYQGTEFIEQYNIEGVANITGILTVNFDVSTSTSGEGKASASFEELLAGGGSQTTPGIYHFNVKKGERYIILVFNSGGVNDSPLAATTPGGDAQSSVTLSWSLEPLRSASNTTISSSLNPSLAGQPVTFTATVSSSTSPPAPTGTVTFLDGTATLGTGTLNASGVATYTTTSGHPLSVGDHSITAVYAGDSNFSGSTSSAITQTVSASVTPPSVSLTYLNWYGAGNKNDPAPNSDMNRGVVFRYTVSGVIPSKLAVPIDFYWATGDSDADIQSEIVAPAQVYNSSKPDDFIINNTPGRHGYLTGEDLSAGNDPARWGTPPPQAKFVLAVIDPLNLLGETDYKGRVQPLALPVSRAAVLKDSVKPEVKGGVNIDATFKPGSGSGQDIPLSEAEVYLGVDHFNWVQKITSYPKNWTKITLKNLDYNRLAIGRQFNPDGVYYENHHIYYYNADGSVDRSASIPYTVDGKSTWFDPIVQPSLADVPHAYTQGVIVNGTFAEPIAIDTDQYEYYYDEPTIANGKLNSPDLGPKTTAYYLMYHDAPQSIAADSPYPKGAYEHFQTELVGVGYDSNNAVAFAHEGFNVLFTWKDNTVVNPRSGGVFLTKNLNYIDDSDVESGGISDVNVGDPKDYVPTVYIQIEEIAAQTIHLGQPMSVTLHTGTAIPGAVLHYSLAANAPAGARIDPTTGRFVFIPHTIGTFPVTVDVSDQRGESASTTFNVTVVPAPAPPTVLVGPSGNATAQTIFTRTGSFQDANGAGPFKATVDYGDGSPVQQLVLNSDKTFKLSHVYANQGTYPITVRISDANGRTGSNRLRVRVTAPSALPPSSGLGPVPAAFVSTLYHEVLGRVPEFSGLRYWASRLVAHVPRPAIVTAFFASPERRTLIRQGHAPKITAHRALVDADHAARKARLS